MGAIVKGYSISVPTTPSLFKEAKVGVGMLSEEGDIRDFLHLKESISAFNPEIVFHMACSAISAFIL